MKLITIRHLWGVTERWEEAFPKFAEVGYSGIEAPMPEASETERLKSLLKQYGFEFIPMVSTHGDTVEEHVTAYRELLEKAQDFGPRFVSCHTGRDFWSDEDVFRFYEQALKLEDKAGLKGAHETHRFRPFYNPWTTSRTLDKLPELNLCCDFSHWVVVCERLLQDCGDNIRQAGKHCLHLHARVGYTEGPQVPDPRAPEYSAAVEAHESWWHTVWDEQDARGLTESTLTPEFGPPGYMHTLPYTQSPVANLAEICDWQAHRQLNNFAKRKSR